MPIVTPGELPIFSGPAPRFHEDKLVVDGGDVHIDADDPEHVIRIKHAVGDGVDVIHARDKVSGVTSFKVDSTGAVVAAGVNLSTLNTLVSAGTHLDDGAANTLVKRNQAAGTQIDNLQVIKDTTNYTAAFPPAGLYFIEGTCHKSLDMIEDAQLSFIPYSPGGTQIVGRNFVFGRAQPQAGQTIAETSHDRDGLLISDDTVDHSVTICCNDSIPTLRIIGSKATITEGGFTKPVCPVIDVQNSSNDTTFAVYDDGFVVQKGHLDTDPDALNSGHWNSGVFGPGSVYIGSSRISYDMTAHKLQVAKLKSAIPVYLVGKGIVAGQINEAYNAITVHGWVARARTLLNNERLTVRDVFPSANADWDVLEIDGPAPDSRRHLDMMPGSCRCTSSAKAL